MIKKEMYDSKEDGNVCSGLTRDVRFTDDQIMVENYEKGILQLILNKWSKTTKGYNIKNYREKDKTHDSLKNMEG
jgi:hypothetical protein